MRKEKRGTLGGRFIQVRTDVNPALSVRLASALQAEEMIGLRMSMLARAIVLVAVGTALMLLLPDPSVRQYELVIALLVLSGLSQYALRNASNSSGVSYLFVVIDAGLLLFGLVFLNAHLHPDRHVAMVFRTSPIVYMFLLLTSVGFLYSTGITVWAGVVGLFAWSGGLLWASLQPGTALFSPGDATMLNENFLDLRLRIEEMVAFALCAVMMSLQVTRSRRLVLRQALAERERGNLARYFPPSVVDELAGRDEPFGPIRRQNVGVLFADIVGFTHMAETMPPEQVMTLLRDFHSQMEDQVFQHGGIVEKFIGDALLANFGVPRAQPVDAAQTALCACALLDTVDRWNTERAARGEPAIRIGIGAHFGPAVLGEIGSRRNAAFAVVGDTVNTSSRLQSLTRDLDCAAIFSDALVRAARESGDSAAPVLGSLVAGGPHQVRGRGAPISIWVLNHRAVD